MCASVIHIHSKKGGSARVSTGAIVYRKGAAAFAAIHHWSVLRLQHSGWPLQTQHFSIGAMLRAQHFAIAANSGAGRCTCSNLPSERLLKMQHETSLCFGFGCCKTSITVAVSVSIRAMPKHPKHQVVSVRLVSIQPRAGAEVPQI